MNVEWKEVNPDYIVSSDGHVASRKFGRLKFLRPTPDRGGYLHVTLHTDSGKRDCMVHSLVAAAFLPPKPSPRHTINHKNGIKPDNRDANLEWMTQRDNNLHAYRHLGKKAPRGEAQGNSKLSEVEVREVRHRCLAGETQKKVAAALGISECAVGEIVNRVTWGWLP